MHGEGDTSRPYVAVVGAGDASDEARAAAEEVGRLLAERGAVLVCGGLGGVMEAASRGAAGAGGIVVGLVPGDDRRAANPYLTVALSTGLGEMRNPLVVRAADAVIAIAGAYGTLSEIAFALRTGKAVVGIGTWDLPDVVVAPGAAEAVELALALGEAARSGMSG
jgi:uncharacterized protein (TIGR00725 family)